MDFTFVGDTIFSYRLVYHNTVAHYDRTVEMIFLIGHKKRHGKDTVAKMIQEYIGGEIISFATPIKKIIADTFDMETSRLNDLKNTNGKINPYDPDSITYRTVLQRFGSGEMKEYFGADVWANLLYDNLDPKYPHHIVPDFRFRVEYSFKTVTINVTRPGIFDDDDHQSETALDDFEYDYTIVNDGSLDDLRKKVYEVVQDALKT